jgi:hypothetical protein
MIGTIRTAEDIACANYDNKWTTTQLSDAIDKALQAERERAAKMVLERKWMFDHELAAAIREGKPQ